MNYDCSSYQLFFDSRATLSACCDGCQQISPNSLVQKLTSKSNSMLNHFQILWLSQFRRQSTTSPLDILCKLQVDLTIPILVNSATAKNYPTTGISTVENGNTFWSSEFSDSPQASLGPVLCQFDTSE